MNPGAGNQSGAGAGAAAEEPLGALAQVDAGQGSLSLNEALGSGGGRTGTCATASSTGTT